MVKHPRVIHRRARSLPIALLRARETVMAPIREMLLDTGLSEQKWRVLRVLDESGPMEQTALARATCLLLPSLTRMLQAMEDDRLIARDQVAHDRRRYLVRLDAAGRGMLDRHAARSEAIFAELQERFGDERTEELLDMLEELAAPDPGSE